MGDELTDPTRIAAERCRIESEIEVAELALSTIARRSNWNERLPECLPPG